MSFFSRLFGASASPPDRPRIVAHVAFDGAIRVFEAPTTEGWENSEDQRQGDGFTVMVLKYVLPLDPMPLALVAKIYTLNGGQAEQDPSTTDWRAVFQALFSSISGVETQSSTQLTMKDSLPATEAIIDGQGANPAVPLRIRERRSVLANEQFIVTAMGSPDAFAQHAEEIEKWFSTSAFVPISADV